jgi:hypothetical protein
LFDIPQNIATYDDGERRGEDNGGKEYIELNCFSSSLNKMAWRERDDEIKKG